MDEKTEAQIGESDMLKSHIAITGKKENLNTDLLVSNQYTFYYTTTGVWGNKETSLIQMQICSEIILPQEQYGDNILDMIARLEALRF